VTWLLFAPWLICCAAFGLFGLQRLMVWWRLRKLTPELPAPEPSTWPIVTVHVPVCGELLVLPQTLGALARVDYPRECFEVLVCDDTPDLDAQVEIDVLVDELRAQGVAVRVIRRAARTDYKAGNLNHALGSSRGEYIAVVDADCQVAPQFLKRCVAELCVEPRLAAVQAEFGHRNYAANRLTRAFDSAMAMHLVAESSTRSRDQLWLEFNGSGGVWRRDAIVSCGGWPTGTGTEDIYLAFLAQSLGLRVGYVAGLALSSNNLPESGASFLEQQRRWAQGAGLVLRQLAYRMWRANAPWRARLEGFVHLGSYAVHAAVCLSSLMAPWVFWRGAAGTLFAATLVAGHGTLMIGSVVLGAQASRRLASNARAGVALSGIVLSGIAPYVAAPFLLGVLGRKLRVWQPTHRVRADAACGGSFALLVVVTGTLGAVLAIMRHAALAAPPLVAMAIANAITLWLVRTTRHGLAAPADYAFKNGNTSLADVK
jgi:cellulose synthase/poly-beta-1,6-N-acetylglucosamine synthase-like glycosyltransferase